MSRVWDKEKKSESPTGFKPMTSQTPGGRSIHLATENSWTVRPYTRFIFDMRGYIVFYKLFVRFQPRKQPRKLRKKRRRNYN